MESRSQNLTVFSVMWVFHFPTETCINGCIGCRLCCDLRGLNPAPCGAVYASFGSTGIFSHHILHPEIHKLTNHSLQKTYATPLQRSLCKWCSWKTSFSTVRIVGETEPKQICGQNIKGQWPRRFKCFDLHWEVATKSCARTAYLPSVMS